MPSTTENICTHLIQKGGSPSSVSTCKGLTVKADCDSNNECVWNPKSCSGALVDAEKTYNADLTYAYKSGGRQKS